MPEGSGDLVGGSGRDLLDRLDDRVDRDETEETAARTVDDGFGGSGHEHRVQGVVKRRARADDRQFLVVVGPDPGRAQDLLRTHPSDGSVPPVQDDDPPDASGLQAPVDLQAVLARTRPNRLLERHVADAGEPELHEARARPDEVLDELVARVGQDPLGGVVLHDVRALVEDDDPVAELDGLVEVMGDEDDRLVQLVLNVDELLLQALAGDGVHRAEGLVHEEHGRIGGECAGHSDALLLTA